MSKKPAASEVKVKPQIDVTCEGRVLYFNAFDKAWNAAMSLSIETRPVSVKQTGWIRV